MRVSLPRVLWAVLGGLALILLVEWAWPSGTDPGGAVHVARAPHVVRGPAAPARDTSAWVSAILARPVFSISRRPPRAVASTHGQAVAGQARLAGILITRTGRHAIFAPEGGGKQLVLAEGAAVNDSTIRLIQPDRVLMASGAVLRPSYDRNRVSAAAQPFQPFQPGFPNPGFPNPGIVNPGFPNPGLPGAFPNPGFPNPGFQPPQPPGEDVAPPNVPLPQVLRGNMIPQRRE